MKSVFLLLCYFDWVYAGNELGKYAVSDIFYMGDFIWYQSSYNSN